MFEKVLALPRKGEGQMLSFVVWSFIAFDKYSDRSLIQIIQILVQEICLFLWIDVVCWIILSRIFGHYRLLIIDQPHKDTVSGWVHMSVRKSYESESDLMLWCWKRLDDHFLMCIYDEQCEINKNWGNITTIQGVLFICRRACPRAFQKMCNKWRWRWFNPVMSPQRQSKNQR